MRPHTRPARSHHPAWPVALYPARRNHPTMKHSITALTMLLIQQCPAKAPLARAYSAFPPFYLSLSLARSLDSIGTNWNRYHIVAASVRPRSRVCVHGFRRGCRHSFSAGPLKRLKRPHDRYVIPRCSRPAVGRAEHDRRPIVIADSRFPPVVMKSYCYRTFNHRIYSIYLYAVRFRASFALVYYAICTCLSSYEMYRSILTLRVLSRS